jgi:flagellar hook-associated protein 3 FlgL
MTTVGDYDQWNGRQTQRGHPLRITHRLQQTQSLAALRENLSRVSEVQRQVSSGRRVERASDDPTAVGSILRASSGLRAIDQYRRNLQTADVRLTLEDTALDSLTNLMIRAKELGVGQGGSNANATTRNVAAAEIDTLIEQIDDIGNSNIAGHYIFGGVNSDRGPLSGSATDPTAPPIGEQQVEISAGRTISTTHSAQEVFIDTGVITAMQALRTALKANDASAVQGALTTMDTAFAEVQEIVGELGARMNQVGVALGNLDSLEINLQTFRSGLEDIDMEKAVTELVSRQGALQAAYAANANILQNTLTDYL